MEHAAAYFEEFESGSERPKEYVFTCVARDTPDGARDLESNTELASWMRLCRDFSTRVQLSSHTEEPLSDDEYRLTFKFLVYEGAGPGFFSNYVPGLRNRFFKRLEEECVRRGWVRCKCGINCHVERTEPQRQEEEDMINGLRREFGVSVGIRPRTHFRGICPLRKDKRFPAEFTEE